MTIIELVEDEMTGWWWHLSGYIRLHGPFSCDVAAARDAWNKFPGLMLARIR
jgi:hypothetical protein